MTRLPSIVLSVVLFAGAANVAACASSAGGRDAGDAPARVTLGFTAWPGWLPWQVAKEQGLFAKHGVNVELKFFTNYTDSLLALETAALDANSQTLNDTLISISSGAKQTIVLVNDNSTGNDKIIARQGITSVAELKGRRIAVEQGTAHHYLLLLALQQAGLSQRDVILQPQPAEAAAAAFAAGQVDAVSVSAPYTNRALYREGSRAIATSAEFPGAIPNHLVVRPALIEEHPDAVQGLVNAWFDTLEWIKENRAAATAIMARVCGVSVADYQTFAAGTSIFTRQQAIDAFKPGTTPKHLNFQATQIADFVFGTGMVQSRPAVAGLLDERFVKAVPD
ncbi:aliphatic sulfonate ABC transporter substrate-binding protein [Allorhizocola rhizosphaerae]|uniref:aliphatic sulfonate ABC transporter substrate-binding protein n=1 Tax=Allorhizocola rhizosphaerae TaxID=1872709 RepID=UPI001B8C6AD8|nr:aliphatic sulfonate ABC transporter substrate-binding protein [Allorhizocola rhizosphaerae]